MKKINYIILLLSVFNVFNAQVLITAGTSTSPNPNSQAVLELYSQNKNKGLLMPKVPLTATNSSSPFPSHIAGMTVYNTNTTNTALTGVTPGFYYNDGASWSRLEVQLPNVGDIKYSSTSPDHDGWYLLDGRALSTLPSAVQTRAISLGFSSALPDSTDRYLKSKSISETLGTTGGSNSVALTQANLPNVTYTTATTSAGLHTHAYNDRASGTTNSVEGGSNKTVVDNDSTTSTTSSAGAHSHTFSVPTGGTNTPLDLQPKYLSAYIFVYLGQ